MTMNTSRKTSLAVFLVLLALVMTTYAGAFVVIKPKYKADAISAPDPNYPPYAEMHAHGGQGVYRLIINDKTGMVDQVQVFKSTHFKELDGEAVMTLFKWKYKPGIKQRDVVVSFEGVGRANQLH